MHFEPWNEPRKQPFAVLTEKISGHVSSLLAPATESLGLPTVTEVVVFFSFLGIATLLASMLPPE